MSSPDPFAARHTPAVWIVVTGDGPPRVEHFDDLAAYLARVGALAAAGATVSHPYPSQAAAEADLPA